MLLNTLLLVPVSFLPTLLGISTAFCGAITVGLDAVFVQHALNVRKATQSQPQARCLCFPYDTCFDLPSPSRRQGNSTNSLNPHADLEKIVSDSFFVFPPTPGKNHPAVDRADVKSKMDRFVSYTHSLNGIVMYVISPNFFPNTCDRPGSRRYIAAFLTGSGRKLT